MHPIFLRCVAYLCYLSIFLLCVCTYEFDTGHLHTNREELVIGNVSTCDYFEWGRGVLKWKSVAVREKNYAVGVTENGISILTIENHNGRVVAQENVVDLQSSPMDIELFKHWNSNKRSYEVILIAGLKKENYELEYFKINENRTLENISTWHLHKKVTNLNVFKMESAWNLLVVNGNPDEHTTVDLYRIDLEKKSNNFWLMQTIELAYPSKHSAVNFYSAHYFLAFPQLDVVDIYKYSKGRFVHYQNLSAENVDFVKSFNIGFKSYLLINGISAGIYHFTKHGLVKEHVRDASLDVTNYLLPIPITTYRDEVILLIQRSPDHGSHKSLAIEAVVSNGGKFSLHDEMPCLYYGENLNGISCLIGEEEHSKGINGSAVISFGNNLGVLIPRNNNNTSVLFTLEIEMKKLPNPVEIHTAKLMATKNRLEKMFNDEMAALGRIEKRVNNSVKLNKPNNISAPWKVDTLVAATLIKPNSTKRAKFERFAQEEIDVEGFAEQIDNIQLQIEGIRKNLEEFAPSGRPTKFKKLVIDGFLHVERQSRIRNVQTQNLNEQPTQVVFEDFVRKDGIDKIGGLKTFTNLEVENITFETINGVASDQLVYNGDSQVKIEGDLVFERTLEVLGDINIATGKVNDVNLVEEVIEIDKPYPGKLQFESVKVMDTFEVKTINEFPINSNEPSKLENQGGQSNILDLDFETMYVPGNLIVDKLNGENFSEILSSICLRNVECFLSGHSIFTQDLTISDHLEINYLNDLKFPEEYVFKTSENFTKIEGKKWFKNSVDVNEMAASGLVNGLNTADLVRLSENQVVPGNFTFFDLEVTEHFDVGQNITGLKTEQLLQNPTLTQTNIITSNVNFNALEVDGIITTGEIFNGSYFRDILDDVVFMNEGAQVINSIKDFPKGLSVRENAVVTSNLINRIPLEEFVTKDTDQVLSVKTLPGSVTFGNLNLFGLFGDVNVTELVQETIKVNGYQYVPATLRFEEELITNYLQIHETLNELKPSEYIFTTGDREFSKLTTLDRVKANEVFVNGNFNGAVENFDVESFARSRLSLNEDQVIKANYEAKSATIKNLKVKKVNGYRYEDLFGLEKYTETISHMLLVNKLKVKELNISGDLTIGSINGVKVDDILNSCAYVGDKLQADVSFLGNVEFSSIHIENFNRLNFDEFISNVVFKNETTLQIDVPKLYANGFEVKNFIDVASLNGIPLSDILRKTGYQEFKGPLTIKGDVSIGDAEIVEYLNEVQFKYLIETFEVLNGAYKINGDVYFERLAYIDNFLVGGLMNDENITDILRHLVSIKDDVRISNCTIFENVVNVKGNLSICGEINGINFAKFKDDVVLINQGAYIDGLVTFAQPVLITEEIRLESDLLGQFVMGIDLQTWKDNAVYINQGPIPGTVSFESTVVHHFIETSHINTLDLSTLIPLRIDQDIPVSLYFSQITAPHDVNVDGLINGIKLQPEVYNTLMIDEDQDVSGPIIFNGNVVIREELNIFGPVNGVDFEKIVTTDTEQNLTAQYNFAGNIVMESNLFVYGLVTGVDLADWERNSIKKKAPYAQRIVKPWTVKENVTFTNFVGGTGLISGLDFRKMVEDVERKRRYKFSVEKGLAADYKRVCSGVEYLTQSAQSQIYKFKYLENVQFIDFQNDIENVHHFRHEDIDYLLVNEVNSCRASLFTWDRSEFNLINQIETGRVTQFVSVREGETLFLVGRSDIKSTHCLFEGSNVWMFVDGEKLLNIFKIENQLLLQESLIPGTFYGLDENFVTEYQIKSNSGPTVRKYRRWQISGGYFLKVDTDASFASSKSFAVDNWAFVPRGLKTGLALRNGQHLLKLSRDEPVIEDELGSDFEAIAIGNVTEEGNVFLPGYNGGDVTVLNVGKPRTKTLVAVASHEEMIVKSRLDSIEIYDDFLTGSLFHKVSTYKPSSLISMEFGNNGETLLVFLENQKALQIFEYKGLEGFKHRTSAKIEGQKLVPMQLPLSPHNKQRNVLGVINKNRLGILKTVMDGDEIETETLQCTL